MLVWHYISASSYFRYMSCGQEHYAHMPMYRNRIDLDLTLAIFIQNIS